MQSRAVNKRKTQIKPHHFELDTYFVECNALNIVWLSQENRQTCGLYTVSLYKEYNKETTFVIFRGDHGLLGLQDGEDSAQDAYAHAGRRRE